MRFQEIYNSPKIKEFIRFCLVGGLATILHYGIYLLLLKAIKIDVVWWTNLAYTFGYVISWFVNLYLTAHFTFKKDVTLKRSVGFAFSHFVNYLLHMLLLNLYLKWGIGKEFAPIFVYLVAVPVNFLLVRFVFKKI